MYNKQNILEQSVDYYKKIFSSSFKVPFVIIFIQFNATKRYQQIIQSLDANKETNFNIFIYFGGRQQTIREK